MPRKRKRRSDAKLDALPAAQKAELHAWLFDENVSYLEAQRRLHERFQLDAHQKTIARYYGRVAYKQADSDARAFAELVGKQLLSQNSTFDRATLALVKQKAFERATARDGDLKELQLLVGLIDDLNSVELKRKSQDLAERRVALLEKKAAQAEAAQQVAAEPKLTPEEKEAKMRAIFGLE